MHNLGDRNVTPAAPNPARNRKRLGGYLVEAGLLTPAQVDVALNDQKLTGMRFGEILAARGWVKQQTIEYLMKKVVLPEQEAAKQNLVHKSAIRQDAPSLPKSSAVSVPGASPNSNTDANRQALIRREVPISKPLPSVGSSDDGVSWVG
jgi:hypothetical protein